MSENELPWPGYRLRPGWVDVKVGEVIGSDSVVRGSGDSWKPVSISIGDHCYLTCAFFRRTNPNATLPPVEPIPAEAVADEPGDENLSDGVLRAVRRVMRAVRHECEAGVDKWRYESHRLQNVLLGVESERDGLRKQVEMLTKERDEWRESARRNLADAERLVEENRQLREVAVKAATAWPETPDWRSKLRPCWVKPSGEWERAWVLEWPASFREGMVLVERQCGKVCCVNMAYDFSLTDPTKEQAS